MSDEKKLKCPLCKSDEVTVSYSAPYMLAGQWLEGGEPTDNIEWDIKPEIHFDTCRGVECRKCHIVQEKVMRVTYKLDGELKVRDE